MFANYDEKLFNFKKSDGLTSDRANKARTAINIYRNTERIKDWNTFFKHQDISKNSEKELSLASEIDIRPAPEIVSQLNENIIIYLNRTMQNLSHITYDQEPHAATQEEYKLLMNSLPALEPARKENTKLYASNAFILIGNIDAGTFRQVASTLYNTYNKRTDKSSLSVKQLKERLEVDFPSMIDPLFNNGLGESKSTLMSLRNTAGHSDISLKVNYISAFGNPTIWVNDQQKNLFETLQTLSVAYLKKMQNVYNAISEEVVKSSDDLEIKNVLKWYKE